MTVVLKLGTTLVVDAGGRPRADVLGARAQEVAAIVVGGEPVCIVSSGAIALGLPTLGLDRRPRALPQLQAASALGQARLHAAWESALPGDVHAAQVLLTAADFADRVAYVNARNTFDALFRLGAVPIVNENDATATDEISFGDNDALAAQVAVLVRARLLVLLTEVEGVFTRAPGTRGAELVLDATDAGALELGDAGALGRGGMRSKVLAARMAAEAGIPTVIAAGTGDGVLPAVLAGEERGTRFRPGDVSRSSYKLWLRFGKPVAARVVVDDGARRAVAEGGASLLAVGVVACEGAFAAGDAVELVGPDGEAFARGIVGADTAEVEARPRGLEVVHRDRLVLY
jgi:glutamate 5-kinase